MEPPSAKKSEKPPLITPSASPPPLRPPAHHRRMSESSPPLKRQRVLSTPLRNSHEASSISRPQSPVVDVQKEREASKIRMLDIWASLAQRYTRRLDEDDIIDILTGEITKDNGVLRNSRKLEFGGLAAPVVDYTTADEGSDSAEDDEEDEYDLDELDSFANLDDYNLEKDARSELEAGGKVVPPVAPLDPADAADFQEFMDAERMRRNICGSENGEEEEEDSGEAVLDQGDISGSEVERPSGFHHFDADTSEFADEEDDEGEDEIINVSDRYSDHIVPLRLDSDEDELGNWNADDTNIVRPILKKEDTEDSDSDIEIIEPPVVTTQSNPRKKSVQPDSFRGSTNNNHSQSQSPKKQPYQLYTPPQSYSSFVASTTPERQQTDRITTRIPMSVAAPSEPFLSRSASKNKSTVDPQVTHMENVSSGLDSTKQPSIPQVDLYKVRPSSKPSLEKSDRQSSKHPTPCPSYAPQPSRPQPFVLLTPRKASSSKQAITLPRSERRRHEDFVKEERVEYQNPTPSKIFKGKGKEKAKEPISVPAKAPNVAQEPVRSSSSPTKRNNRHEDCHEESDDPITISSSPPKSSRSYVVNVDEEETFFSVSSSHPRASSSSSVFHAKSPRIVHDKGKTFVKPQSDLSSSPLPRKRKRVVSDPKAESSHSKDHESTMERNESIPERDDNFNGHPHASGHASTSYLPRAIEVNRVRHSSPRKRSSSQRRQITPDSESEYSRQSSPSAPDSGVRYQLKRSQSRQRSQTPLHYSYSHSNTQYPTTHPPPHGYAPMPDPRAQLIIAQAMQQLSALVGASWTPLHQYSDNNHIPQTPSHRHQSSRPSKNAYVTPTHCHHPQPYYDPNLSHATTPPDSPEFETSPEKSSPSRRKSLVGRSRSRGRRVSFKFDERNQTREAMGVYSSPSPMASSKHGSKKHGSRKERTSLSREDGITDKYKGKGKAKAGPPTEEFVSDHDTESDSADERGRTYYVRGQTPGPNLDSPRKRNADKQSSSATRRDKHESRQKYRDD